MEMDLNFADMAMNFDPLNVLPTYSLAKKPSTDRLRRLRQFMAERGIDGYLIVDSDAHYTYYAQARQDRRINYITNSEVPYLVTSLISGAMWSCNCRQRQSGVQAGKRLSPNGRSRDGRQLGDLA